jgi:hypothetical protein
MSLLESRTIRAAITVGAPFATTRLIDVATGQMIETVRGNFTRFEFGFFNVAGVALDLSDIESLNLKLQPSQTVAGLLADQTITVLDNTLTAETWADGSKQHAVFEFSNAEMNIDPQGEVRQLWCVLTGITTTGREITPIGSSMLLHEDNNGTADPAPENPGTAITMEQADARYPRAIARTLAQGPPENVVLALGGIEFQPSANPSVGATVTIGLVTYTFVATADADGEVSIGATSFDTATNLLDEINGDGRLPANSLVTGLGVGSGPTVNMESKFDGYTDEEIALSVGGTDPGYWATISPFATTTGDVASALGQPCIVGDSPGPFRIFMAVHKHPSIWQETTPGHLVNTTTGDTQKLVVSGAADSEILTITDL